MDPQATMGDASSRPKRVVVEMSGPFTESFVEEAALACLPSLGYAVLHGPDIATDELRVEPRAGGKAGPLVGANCSESRTLASLRDTLLPELILGELRVNDAGKIIERVV